MNKECDFCGRKGNWKNVLKDTQIFKKDGSDVILCDDCLNHYANQEYDKIKLKNKRRFVEDDVIAKESLEEGKIESFVNKSSELLEKYQKQNAKLKSKGKFNLQQANYTMKRFAEELSSFTIKKYLREKK